MEKENYVKGEKKIIGIYKIFNKINNKVYIGSSSFVQARLRQHKSHLSKNIHCNKHLQSSYNKYLAENFNFEIIEECTLENLLNREQYWIDLLQSTESNKGYNKRKKAESNNGLKRSTEARKNISNGKKGKRYLSDEHYEKLAESRRGIPNKAAIKYQQSLSSEEKTFNAIRAVNARKKKAEERGSYNTIEGQTSYKLKRGHKVYQYDQCNNLINVFLSISDALRYLNMSVKNTSCIKNQIDTEKLYKGYLWRSIEHINSNINNEFGELLGSPEEDNQQPIISLND